MFLKESLARVPRGKWFQIRKKKHSIKEVETNKTKQQITIEHLVIPRDKKAPTWLASFFLRFIYFVNMSVLPLCVCACPCMCVWCLWRSGKGIESPKTGVTVSHNVAAGN